MRGGLGFAMRKAVVVVMMAISKNTALGLGCGTHVCVCV